MTKRFICNHPDQLKEIARLCKDDGNTKIINTAKVWSVTRRQKGKAPWDGKISASFGTEGRERKACVIRLGTNDKISVIGWLKYNPALKWCGDNLEISE